MAFPGWTLPGVMTAGAGQRLTKVNGVLPGQRIVIAGTGPFLFAVAESLISRGASIAAVIEARKPSMQFAVHLARYPERWGEAWHLIHTIRRHASRLIFGRIIIEAMGRDQLEGIRLATLDLSQSEEIKNVDALLISHGFQPSIDVTCLLGCVHLFDDDLGGWFVEADPSSGQSSIEGVFAAGEVMGVAGAQPAMLSGELAGLSAVSSLGYPVSQARINSVVRKLRRARKFGHGLGHLFAPPRELAGLVRDDTVLCRCEEVTFRQIREACAEGARSAYGSKIWTRAGMGRCQGRMCRMTITQILARETGRSVEDIGFNCPRVPIRPTPLADVLAAMSDEN
jgi:NADPH-dependent 2,4-dienoyl-CoA reductase/sulfur reductase-like enzyme